MRTSFDIVLSRTPNHGDLAAAIGELIPEGFHVDVSSDVSDPPGTPDALWCVVGSTGDPAWPCKIEVYTHGDELGPGSFPDLRMASHLCESLRVDALCDTYPFAGEFDPHDPYWFLACIQGRWYLASAVETRLMDERASGAIQLVREVAVLAG